MILLNASCFSVSSNITTITITTTNDNAVTSTHSALNPPAAPSPPYIEEPVPRNGVSCIHDVTLHIRDVRCDVVMMSQLRSSPLVAIGNCCWCHTAKINVLCNFDKHCLYLPLLLIFAAGCWGFSYLWYWFTLTSYFVEILEVVSHQVSPNIWN